ncbi:MAG: hypothetical protein E7271_07940 [Lachnospiraceae bacterium]|jgi:hypothetical protein|nr:hypothetical protein [Lachnospiraceae bacterium]
MGISIHLSVSKSVKKEEWKAVYEESLKMVKAFPLAELREIDIDGIDTICLVETEEHQETYGWYDEKTRVGWDAVGDYRYMRIAEDYYLPRDLVDDKKYIERCEDAMFGILPAYLDYDWQDKQFDITYDIWGAKTQGEPYHMYLLAIACMIESRLSNKAFVYGDITRGQCVRAVELANEVLDNPIEIPARCDLDRLLERVSAMPLTEQEKIRAFECIYLGNKDVKFGEYIRNYFSDAAFIEYWEKRFSHCTVEQFGFLDIFSDYILWGFDLSDVCRYVKFKNKDGKLLYEDFVKYVMDTKLHLLNKDCSDPLKIDEDESRPYGVSTLFAQLVFIGAKNKKIDRFIPIEEIRKALTASIGDKCDVNNIIDNYLSKEAEQDNIDLLKISTEEDYIKACDQDPSELYKQYINNTAEKIEKIRETYDIADFDYLPFYESGDTISPGILKSLGKSFAFYRSILEEDSYKELMRKDYISRCRFLVDQNSSIFIRDTDWRKIFKDIRENDESFARYYPMVRVSITSKNIAYMINAIVLNDELYEYCFELASQYEKE